jgi:hypothetical protein
MAATKHQRFNLECDEGEASEARRARARLVNENLAAR